MQLARRHTEGSAAQRACHMLALGPPISEIDPEKPSRSAKRLTSSKMEASERDAMHRPWCSASVQKEQPPPQPLCDVMLVAIMLSAGIVSLYEGWDFRVNGKA